MEKSSLKFGSPADYKPCLAKLPHEGMNYDAIVIGSGIVGISTAYHLVGEGAKTLLIDRRDPGRETVTDISPFHITRFP